MYNKCIHAVTGNSPSSARQRSAGWGRVDAWRRCGSWLVGSKHGEDAICLDEVGLCVRTRAKPQVLSLCSVVSWLWGAKADEISAQLSHREQTEGHHQEVALLCESAARWIYARKCNAPAPHTDSSRKHLCHTAVAFISPQSDFESIFFFKIWCCSLSTDSSNLKDQTWAFYSGTNCTCVHKHLENTDKGKGSCFVFFLLHYICDPLAAASEQYCWH